MRILEKGKTMSHYISDDAFAHMVAQEVKNKASEEHRQFLCQPENLDRWMRALNALLDNLNGQIENSTQDMIADEARYSGLGEDGIKLGAEAKMYYENKINKAERFKFHVVKRVSDVAGMISLQKAVGADEEKLFSLCRDAIEAHRMYLLRYDIETTPADEALYKALEGVWAFERLGRPEEADETETSFEKNGS